MSQRANSYREFDSYINDVIRSRLDLDISNPGDVCPDFPDDMVVTLPSETSAGSVLADDIWEWPERILRHLPPSGRCINFSLPHNLRTAGGLSLLHTIKILIILCIVFPLGRRKRLPSLRDYAVILNDYCHDILTKTNARSFSELHPDDYVRLIEECGRGRRGFKQKLLAYLDTLREYGRRGLIADYPGANGVPDRTAFQSSGDCEETTSDQLDDDEGAEVRADGEDSRQYQPLSDDFLAELGWRCTFYLDQIGPNLVRLFADHPDLPHRRSRWFPKGRGRNGPAKATIKSCRSNAWKKFLREFRWVDSEGAPLVSMPFSCDELIFPPQKHMDVIRLVGRHMDALICMLMLLSGGRATEIQSFRRDVVTRPSSATDTDDSFALVDGQTMKPSATNLGDNRNWPIPETVAKWIANQTALAKVLGPTDSQGIWMGMSTTNPDVARVDMYHRCTQFAVRHGLSHLVEGNAHPHRYRKSIARLALLALTGAPMLIMQMFGHRDLMSTLRYLLSDPFIRDDLRELLGERRIEIALNLMEDIDGAAGQASHTLRSARDAYFDEMKVPHNARSQKISLLQFITARLVDGAVDIKIVYPGVVCIRGVEQDGACANKGHPIDPSRCQSRCNFRMDLALRKSEVTAIIEDCLDAYFLARGKQNVLILSALAANIFDNVEIYPEIRDHYLDDARYQVVLNDCDD